MRSLAVLTLLIACGGSSSENQPDASVPDGEVDASELTESHPLGLNDVSILVRLPDDTGTPSFAKVSGFLPATLFDRLVTIPGDVGWPAADFHVVAMRFDLCDHVVTGACPATANGQLRLVFQPLFSGNGTEAADAALHASYVIPAGDLAWVVNELRALARIRGFQTASPIAINETITASAASSEYVTRLRALVMRYAKPSELEELTVFALKVTAHPFKWVFRGVRRNGTAYDDIMIPLIETTQQDVILFESPASYAATPVADIPAGFQLALDGSQFESAAGSDRMIALGALAASMNPTMHTPRTQQCAGCHVSTYLTKVRSDLAGVNPSSIPNTFTSARNLSIDFGVAKQDATTLRAFGYHHRLPAISQRVANESAIVVDEIEQRFPPH